MHHVPLFPSHCFVAPYNVAAKHIHSQGWWSASEGSGSQMQYYANPEYICHMRKTNYAFLGLSFGWIPPPPPPLLMIRKLGDQLVVKRREGDPFSAGLQIALLGV